MYWRSESQEQSSVPREQGFPFHDVFGGGCSGVGHHVDHRADPDELDRLSAEEVSWLLAWAEVNQSEELPLYGMAVYTGMRMGEL